MPVDRDNLGNLVEKAWCEAMRRTKNRDAEGPDVNKERSLEWVDCLAKGFQRSYADRGHRTFWKGNRCNRKAFFRNEFLFDVVVGHIETVHSLGQNSKELRFIAGCEWLVESELDNKNSRQIVVDMSKLVMGAAKSKLFVASHRPSCTEKKILERCGKIAERCCGDVYFGFIAHPSEWKSNPGVPSLYEWSKDASGFRSLSSDKTTTIGISITPS